MRILGLACWMFMLLASGGPGPEVVFPPNGAHFSGSRAVIVGRGTDMQTSLGERVVQSVPAKGYPHLVVRLAPGANAFPLVLIQGRNVVRKKWEIHSFPSPQYASRNGYTRFHDDPSSAELCRSCHAPSQPLGTCRACHPDKSGEAAYPHEGFDPDDCGGCHDESTQEIVTPCGDCHELEETRLHAPYAQRECALCHDPHGSDHPRLLRAEVRTVCTWCHRPGDYLEGRHPVFRHPMEKKEITCVSCHHPHGSPFPALTKWAPEVICGTCHHQ